MFDDFSYSIDVCPHNYYPDDDERVVYRLTATKGDELAIFADYLFDGDWVYFIYVHANPDFRDVPNFINHSFVQGHKRVGDHTSCSCFFWFFIPSSVAPYIESVSSVVDGITIAVSGSSPCVVRT